MLSITPFFLLLLVLPRVASHGFVTAIYVNGKRYNGINVKQWDVSLPNSPIRPVRAGSGQNPLHLGEVDDDFSCGTNAKPVDFTAPVDPGAKLEFEWRTGNGQKWPHDQGPVMTYMASCGDQGCKKMDPSQARWFKIAQTGKDKNGHWFQADIMNKKANAVVTLPRNIRPGNYLIRHEMISTHIAESAGPEFYPGCTQVKVSGSGTGGPTNDELVSFPGAYKKGDKNLFDRGTIDGKNWKFPGPPIANFVSEGPSQEGATPKKVATTPHDDNDDNDKDGDGKDGDDDAAQNDDTDTNAGDGKPTSSKAGDVMPSNTDKQARPAGTKVSSCTKKWKKRRAVLV